MYFDGTGDYLTIPSSASLALTDFTVEGWINPSSFAAQPVIVASPQVSSGGWVVTLISTGNLCVGYGNTTLMNTTFNGSVLKLNTWTHFAFTRSGSTMTLWINGVSSATATYATAMVQGITYIGTPSSQAGNATYSFNGYLADLRIINGTALYTTAFTPPSAPLTAVTNTQLLLNGTNAAIVDSTGKIVVETVGTAKVSTTKRYSSSMYFDGTASCYAKISASTQTNLGTGDFTIEMWAMPTASAATSAILFCYGSSAENVFGINNLNNTAYLATWTPTLATIYEGTSTAFAWALNTWHHLAIVRNAGVTKFYFDGVAGATTITDPANWNTAAYMCLGGVAGSYLYTGYIEDFRLTKGVARYTSNFTVPLAPLPVV
jgi:hypothetical protein